MTSSGFADQVQIAPLTPIERIHAHSLSLAAYIVFLSLPCACIMPFALC